MTSIWTGSAIFSSGSTGAARMPRTFTMATSPPSPSPPATRSRPGRMPFSPNRSPSKSAIPPMPCWQTRPSISNSSPARVASRREQPSHLPVPSISALMRWAVCRRFSKRLLPPAPPPSAPRPTAEHRLPPSPLRRAPSPSPPRRNISPSRSATIKTTSCAGCPAQPMKPASPSGRASMTAPPGSPPPRLPLTLKTPPFPSPRARLPCGPPPPTTKPDPLRKPTNPPSPCAMTTPTALTTRPKATSAPSA